jgi:hypothetical protein
MMRLRCVLLVSLFALPPGSTLHAQMRESALSDSEVEKLRDTAAFPADRVTAFIGFLDDRTREIARLSTGTRKPGREDDLHDLIEQFTSVADDLEDNLDDYDKRHADLRKVLPKLLAASERWGTILRSPPENETYTITRKLALEALKDIHDQTAEMIEEQRVWFAAHPPSKEPPRTGNPENTR